MYLDPKDVIRTNKLERPKDSGTGYAFPQWWKTFVLVGTNDLQARSAYQPTVLKQGSRYILYVGHHTLTTVGDGNDPSKIPLPSLNRLTGHVKHLPIFFALLLLYSLGKQFHLSPLMLVLAFGLLLNNVFLLDRIKWLKQHESEGFEQDLTLFKQIVMEGAFFVRTFFFLLLGFSTDLIDFASSTAWVVTGAIIVLIYATRWPLLRVLCPADSAPLLWIAPRGLITVVLFLNSQAVSM